MGQCGGKDQGLVMNQWWGTDTDAIIVMCCFLFGLFFAAVETGARFQLSKFLDNTTINLKWLLCSFLGWGSLMCSTEH